MSWNRSSSFTRITSRWDTLALRLTAGYALVGLLVILISTGSLYFVLVAELDRSTDLFLADKINVIRTMLRERPDDDDGLREEVELESAARRYEQFYIRLLNEQNVPVMSTPGMAEQLDMARFPEPAQATQGHAIAIKGKDGRPFRVTSAVIPVGSEPSQNATIQVAIDVSQKEELLGRYRYWFGIILLGSLAVFPAVGYRIARQGIHPVEEISTTARHISSTNLHERIHPEGYPAELASLAGTFNEMLDRLEESFDRISRFTADIAHDLRTPVNNIRGEAEVALARTRTPEEYRNVIESSLEESVRLSNLISDLLFLARAESPLNHLHWASVDVGELLYSVKEYYEGAAVEAGIALFTTNGHGPVVAELDRTLMQRVVGNLISNAIAHTPSGGSITLSAKPDRSDVLINISDTGVGIPPEALPRVFDRFFRVDTSRTQASGSSGLGLAIVKSIVQLHGGTVEIASQVGKGTHVMLRMPVTSPR